MKIDFQNLGTIKKTTLDLRPLTVIVGPNNTSKTYLAYCVHGLLKSLSVGQRHGWPDELPLEHAFKLAELIAGAEDFVKGATSRFTKRLAEYFQDTYGGLFKEAKLGIRLDEKELVAALESAGLSRGANKRLTLKAPMTWGRNEAFLALLDSVADSLSRAPLTLPAERNAFIMTYKMLSARRYRVLRDRERSLLAQRDERSSKAASEARAREMGVLREQGDIRYPRPIEDFLDFLTDVELDAARPLNDDKSSFGKLARAIETHIQGGHRTGYTKTALGGSELALTVREDLRIDLYNASSSIKQLAPLLLYLRYRAAPGQTLIIDEPEMNLHPEGQAKLLEALGMLANLGVHVLLTTHSPYFMAHLNNLIAADTKSAVRKKRQAKHLYMGDPAAFLAPEDVSAYEMRAEGLVSLADPEYGIRWDTLSDVSSELQRRYFAIVEESGGRGKAK